MHDDIVELIQKIKNNSIKFSRKDANEIIHQYCFHYVDINYKEIEKPRTFIQEIP